jgi:hypothetical protein
MKVYEGTVVGVVGQGTGRERVDIDVPALRPADGNFAPQGSVHLDLSTEEAADYLRAKLDSRRVRLAVEFV